MPGTLPFHSSRHAAKAGAAAVFHTNEACDEALLIRAGDWRAGASTLPPCERCARINALNDRAS